MTGVAELRVARDEDADRAGRGERAAARDPNVAEDVVATGQDDLAGLAATTGDRQVAVDAGLEMQDAAPRPRQGDRAVGIARGRVGGEPARGREAGHGRYRERTERAAGIARAAEIVREHLAARRLVAEAHHVGGHQRVRRVERARGEEEASRRAHPEVARVDPQALGAQFLLGQQHVGRDVGRVGCAACPGQEDDGEQRGDRQRGALHRWLLLPRARSLDGSVDAQVHTSAPNTPADIGEGEKCRVA
jgi:hypothetical protein